MVHLLSGCMINLKTRVQLLVVECNSRLVIIIITCRGFSFVFVTVFYFVGSSQTEWDTSLMYKYPRNWKLILSLEIRQIRQNKYFEHTVVLKYTNLLFIQKTTCFPKLCSSYWECLVTEMIWCFPLFIALYAEVIST